jgi:hypothetical protein
VVNANSPFGLYTSLILSSYTSYLLKVSSSFASFTAPSRAQKAFGGVGERQASDPSLHTPPPRGGGVGHKPLSGCRETGTGDEEKRKSAEETLHRFDFGVGGIRLKLVHKEGKGVRAEKYGDPQLIAEIKTALERKLREILGDEYEQWRDHVKTTEGGKRLIITQHLLQRLAQNPNTAKQNEKT